jgi:hypothetical protein
MCYLSVCPILTWSGSGWLTVPISALVAFLLLSTGRGRQAPGRRTEQPNNRSVQCTSLPLAENIGAQIEEPFTVLPLSAICKWVGRGCQAVRQQAHAAAAQHQLAERLLWTLGGACPARLPRLARATWEVLQLQGSGRRQLCPVLPAS